MHYSSSESPEGEGSMTPATLLDLREKEAAEQAVARRIAEVLSDASPDQIAEFMRQTLANVELPTDADSVRFHADFCRSMLDPTNWSDEQIRKDYQRTTIVTLETQRTRLLRLLTTVSLN